MKKLILLICMLAGMSSCYHQDALIVPEQPDKYNILTDDPSDPTQHFIYQFYQKYQTVIITNPTEADYKFNFTANNGIKITAPEQKQEIIDEGIEFLQKVLLNLYSDSFLKKNLPFSILLSEEVRMASYGETTIMNCYASSSFIALGNVSSSLETMTDEEFVKIRADVNASFWAKYMSEVRGLFTISDAFYEASEEVEPKLYDPNWYRFKGTDPNEIDFYKYGVITYSENSYIDEDWPDFNSIYAPLKSEDLAQWMNFVFEKTPAEIQEICDKYPVMKKKYDVIREAMLENGFDLSKLEL